MSRNSSHKSMEGFITTTLDRDKLTASDRACVYFSGKVVKGMSFQALAHTGAFMQHIAHSETYHALPCCLCMSGAHA